MDDHNYELMMDDSHICKICGESKDPSKARFEHRRLGLDEPPEPVVCRCRDPATIFGSITSKITSVMSITKVREDMTMESLPYPSFNMVMIETTSPVPIREVELRLSAPLAKMLYNKMDKGLFQNATKRTISEMGCVWWTGIDTNSNARVRRRSNGESVIKVPRYKAVVVPGYTLAVSDEYSFDGVIRHPTYISEMTEIKYVMTMSNDEGTKDVKVNIIAREYNSNGRESYAAEFEIEDEATNKMVKKIICMSAGIVGNGTSMRSMIDITFMSDVRSRDHIVIDVPNMDGYRGRYMAKADGMKVYVFCYSFGYVVTLTDPDMTIISCMVTVDDTDMIPVTSRPDVAVAEMLMDGSLVYIDTLAMNGIGSIPMEVDRSSCPLVTERPMFIYRRSWDRMPTKTELMLEPTPNDGVVLVNELRTLRLKQPTVDLVYMSGKMHASDNGVMVPVGDGDQNMEEGVIYEMDLIKDKITNTITMIKPRPRIAKRIPNSMDVVKRAVASTSRDPLVDAALLDLTSMSFSMRDRVYTMARTKASMNRKVIVTFGIGRFQEWRQMMVDNMSYIAIDPNLDVTMIEKKMRRVSIMPYDWNTPFNTQVISISKKGSTILWAKCKSEYFIDKAMPSRIMAMAGIPAMFSFSISYHIGVINRLLTEGVAVFGCGFVHDAMPRSGVGSGQVGMKPVNSRRTSGSDIVAKFGKSTYIEPYLSRSAVKGLFLVKDEMPTLWKSVDSNTVEIMERAVIMCALQT